jgi:hypothetical protein
MKILKLVVCLGALALTAAAESKYKVTLFEPTVIGGTELKPGDYTIAVDSGMATIKNGKSVVETPVKVENGSQKYDNTTVRYEKGDGRNRVDEIRLGGTRTKLVFTDIHAGGGV